MWLTVGWVGAGVGRAVSSTRLSTTGIDFNQLCRDMSYIFISGADTVCERRTRDISQSRGQRVAIDWEWNRCRNRWQNQQNITGVGLDRHWNARRELIRTNWESTESRAIRENWRPTHCQRLEPILSACERFRAIRGKVKATQFHWFPSHVTPRLQLQVHQYLVLGLQKESSRLELFGRYSVCERRAPEHQWFHRCWVEPLFQWSAHPSPSYNLFCS